MTSQYDKIRPDIRAALARYAREHSGVGGFLRAVLSNDLMEALGRADDENRAAIWEICLYVHNEMPSLCHGSPERYKEWIKDTHDAI